MQEEFFTGEFHVVRVLSEFSCESAGLMRIYIEKNNRYFSVEEAVGKKIVDNVGRGLEILGNFMGNMLWKMAGNRV